MEGPLASAISCVSKWHLSVKSLLKMETPRALEVWREEKSNNTVVSTMAKQRNNPKSIIHFYILVIFHILYSFMGNWIGCFFFPRTLDFCFQGVLSFLQILIAIGLWTGESKVFQWLLQQNLQTSHQCWADPAIPVPSLPLGSSASQVVGESHTQCGCANLWLE